VADLAVQLGPLRLKHPLINASGTLDLFTLAEATDPRVLREPPVAAYVPKTVTLAPRAGNPPPRILETPDGMINAIGLPGEGLEAFIATELPQLLSLPRPLMLSIAGFSVAELVALASGLRQALDHTAGKEWSTRVGLELNISCPNVQSGCLSIGSDPSETEEAVGAVREFWPGLLVAKLTPNVADIAAIGRAAERAGADAVAAVNTFKGLVLDRASLRPYLGNISGGVSGPAIKPLALQAVYELYESVSVPIVGMGGVATVQDVLEFMACGARVVAVGSAGFRDQLLAGTLALGLEAWLDERGSSLGELVGLAHTGA
jgi:dihydroorotate dehydrogenase (NAD+) catalytic subunit